MGATGSKVAGCLHAVLNHSCDSVNCQGARRPLLVSCTRLRVHNDKLLAGKENGRTWPCGRASERAPKRLLLQWGTDGRKDGLRLPGAGGRRLTQ